MPRGLFEFKWSRNENNRKINEKAEADGLVTTKVGVRNETSNQGCDPSHATPVPNAGDGISSALVEDGRQVGDEVECNPVKCQPLDDHSACSHGPQIITSHNDYTVISFI